MKPSTIDYITRLRKAFGSELSIHLFPVMPYGDGGVARALRRNVNARLWTQFRDEEPEMYQFSETDPRLTVIWDRYRPDNDSARLLLRKLLIGVGIWDTHVNHLWAAPHLSKGVARPPDMARYRPWLMEALRACFCQPVLLVGHQPLWLWRPDLRLSTSQGNIGVWRSQWVVMPVESPERLGKGEVSNWTRTLRRFTDRFIDGRYLEYLPQKCIKCDNYVFWYDSDAVPWCRQHVTDGLQGQEKGVNKWQALESASGQLEITTLGE